LSPQPLPPVPPVPLLVVAKTLPLSKWQWGVQNLFKKTPRLARRLGKGLVAMATFFGGTELRNGHDKLGGYILFGGLVGWFLSEMFTDEPATKADAEPDPSPN
jgi:hypothetical protein